MFGWKNVSSGLLVLLVGCSGGDEINSCLGDTVVSCPCPGGLTGESRCEDGALSECVCPDTVSGQCTSDIECDDGAFCNGRERCDPLSEDADVNGCVPAEFAPLCDDGIDCTEDACDDAQNRCVFSAPDEDRDGHGDSECLGADGEALGDDCDDDNADRYPGNFEICDDDNVDEDCDPNTFGIRDQDGDGAIDMLCCNGDNCGDDCNDKDIAQNPNQPEFCDEVDNDCDGKVDEKAAAVPWYVDNDGDGFGTDEYDIIESCIPIAERSLLPTDCNDGEVARHPAQLEICDLADNNCNGLADEGPDCGVPLGYPVLPGSGGIVTPPGGTGGASGSGGSNSGGSNTGGMSSGGSGGMGTGGSGTGGNPGLDISCDDREVMGATVVGGSLPSGLTTWSGVVHMTSNVTVGGPDHLVIDPGTSIIADPGVELVVAGGRVDFEGADGAPVRFCGKEDTSGYWMGIRIQSADPESSIEWTLIADGGGNGADAALVARANVPIRHVRVENSGDVGVYATEWGFQSSDLTVTTSAGEALVLTSEEALRDLPLGGSFTGNTEDVARYLDNSLAEVTTMRNVGLTYLVKQSINQSASSELTIEAGVVVEMEAETRVVFGWNTGSAKVNIEGTAEEPVVFRGRQEGAGFWNGLAFRNNIRAGSEVSHLVVQDAGYAEPAVLLEKDLPIDGLTIENTNDDALNVGALGFHPTSQGISIADSNGRALVLSANAVASLPADTQFANTNSTEILINDGIITDSGTIPALSLPYYVEDYLRTGSSAIVDIAPGAHFLFGDDANFLSGWNGQTATLRINGTAQDPVVFDHLLGDAGNGFAYLYLNTNTTLDSTVNYLEIHNAGSTGYGAIRLAPNPAIAAENLTNITIEDSASWCIYNGSSDKSQDYTMNGNTFINCLSGNIGP